MGGIGVSPNQALAMYLHWMFRVNFFILFSLSCFFFFGMVIFFSAFIVIAGTIDSDCVRIGSKSFGEADSPFADAFALSWTTLSTVVSGLGIPFVTKDVTFANLLTRTTHRDMEVLIQPWLMKMIILPTVLSSL